jgi:cysteinyl-tRNA synthetase
VKEIMALRVYNSQTRQKELFTPLDPPRVGMYVCGVTVYDSCHIGHARSMIVFDVIYRALCARGYAVRYVRNFTDIDDKIIQRSQREGVSAGELAEKYIQEFYRDMAALGVLSPEVEPRATAHVAQIIALVEKLIRGGYAYETEGDVFFRVARFGAYGALSGRNVEEMQAGARIDVDPRKENPMDFALWKAAKPGEPFWESPWGPGRPGWHIECSAMSAHYLGESFDIHGGGQDLIFPHHENEVAQSTAASGRPLARYWIHNGFVTISGEKMSKSLGNFLTIQELLEHCHPEALRLFLLSRHYRSPVDYSDQALAEAQSHLHRLYRLLQDLENPAARPQQGGTESFSPEKTRELAAMIDAFQKRFAEALDDDFNTAQALAHFHELARGLNRFLDTLAPKAWEHLAAPLKEAAQRLRETGALLGILTEEIEAFFDRENQRLLARRGLTTEAIEGLLAERAQARRNKDWAGADRIRERLRELGVVVKDGPQGTLWSLEE